APQFARASRGAQTQARCWRSGGREAMTTTTRTRVAAGAATVIAAALLIHTFFTGRAETAANGQGETMRTSTKTVLAGAAVLAAGAAFAETRLQGAGATFPAPLYKRWVADYQKSHPDVQIDYQSIGSGGGIKAITEKTVAFA